MADPSSYRPRPGEIPDSPGVYKFRDEHRRVIYVGKAKSLRQRLANYFQDLAGLHPRTRTMVTTAASVEWTVVSTEVEALQLEYSWIKEFDPRFNVKYRDDKSYPYLAVTMNEEFPRVQVMRGAKKKGVRYFGPYSHAWAIRETVDLLLRVFPVRTCSAGVFKNAAQIGRPCLLGYIGKCSAPCVGRVSAEEHRELAEEFCDFMAGRTDTYIRRLEKRDDGRGRGDGVRAGRPPARRHRGPEEGHGEERGRPRRRTDADLIALAEDELEAAVQIFHVRGGRVRGQRGWVTDKVEDVTTAALVEHALQQLYGEETGDSVPKEVLVPALPDPVEPVQQWLTERAARGERVAAHPAARRQEVPHGDRPAQRPAVAACTRPSAPPTSPPARRPGGDRRGPRPGQRAAADRVLRHLAPPGRRRRGVDGRLRGRLARKSEYRRFQIKGFEGQDDVRSMHEVITRRFRRYLAEKEKTGEWADGDELSSTRRTTRGRPKRFAYPPQLVVVDGGQPQVAAAKRALDELGIDDIAVCGLAKRLEEVWLPDEDDPVVLPRTSEGLYLLQRVRDEAHRFAITYQRAKRAKRFRASPLDDVPGLGETRKQALIKHFGSVKKLRSATIDQICEVPGIGRKTAETIAVALAQAAPAAPAVNTATGEIMEDMEDGTPGTTAGAPGEPVPAGAPDERRGQET
jgi:excinuclease ABC subunit C